MRYCQSIGGFLAFWYHWKRDLVSVSFSVWGLVTSLMLPSLRAVKVVTGLLFSVVCPLYSFGELICSSLQCAASVGRDESSIFVSRHLSPYTRCWLTVFYPLRPCAAQMSIYIFQNRIKFLYEGHTTENSGSVTNYGKGSDGFPLRPVSHSSVLD